MATTKGPDLVSGIVTSWIPLTTPGPASINECSSAIYYIYGSGNLVAFDPAYGVYVDPAVKCLASEHSLWWTQPGDTAINLGPFACPTGYTTATASPMNMLTTVIGCCPNKYNYQGKLLSAGFLPQCLSPLTAGQVVTAKSASGSFTWYAVTTTIATSQNIMGVHINGFVFNDATDPGSPASTSATTTSIGSVPSSGSLTGTSSPSPGLGSGAKIGIGVGVSLAVVGVLCLLLTYFLLRRRAREKAGFAPQEVVEAPGSNVFVDQLSKVPVPFVEAPSDSVVSMTRAPVEMWVPTNNGG